MDHRDRLISCFRKVFPGLSNSAIVSANMRNVGAWDSAALLFLMAAVEREFRITFNADQVNRFTSFAAILEMLQDTSRPEATPKRSAG